jgi:endonuclease-3 related protein
MPHGEPNGTRRLLLRVYRRLRSRYGHAGWWPGDSSFEVCVGAILVQNTAWVNVERTLDSLRQRGLLSFEALHRRPPSGLAPRLRSSGTFRVKARRLRAFLDFLGSEYGGRAEAMAAEDPARLRQKLLLVPGIGPETADSIALYAAGHPVFVVDAYARRVFSRLGLLPGEDRAGRALPTSSGSRGGGPRGTRPEAYDRMQRFLMDNLPRDAALYNDYHAQLVRVGQEACRTRPRCAVCPLDDLCPKHGLLSSRGTPIR